MRDIVEVYEISNDTVVTAIGRDSLSAVWSAPLPRGFTNFTPASGDVAASSLRARDGRVELVAPFAPGVKQLSFTYRLDARAFPLEIVLDRPNAAPRGARSRSRPRRCARRRCAGRARRRPKGAPSSASSRSNAPDGERVRIEVPSSAASARSTVIVALSVAVTLAMISALWIAYRRGAGAAARRGRAAREHRVARRRDRRARRAPRCARRVAERRRRTPRSAARSRRGSRPLLAAGPAAE